MNKMLTAVLMATLAVSSPSWAGRHDGDARIDYAKVTRVEPITRNIERRVPVEECWTETVRYDTPAESYGDDSLTGTILGGVIGGAIGNAVGHKKRNKQVGTAVGAILGASIGRDLSHQSRHYRRGEPVYRDERRCETHYETHYEEKVIGYNVWYRYNGNLYSTRMDHDPGKKIRVRVSVTPL